MGNSTQTKGSSVGAHIVYGDERDLRATITRIYPHWQRLPEDIRTTLFAYGQAVLDQHNPLKGQCVACQTVVPFSKAFRCHVCNAVLCADDIEAHLEGHYRKLSS